MVATAEQTTGNNDTWGRITQESVIVEFWKKQEKAKIDQAKNGKLTVRSRESVSCSTKYKERTFYSLRM